MTFSRPRADPRSPPSDFDELVDWFERVSCQLVLLEAVPLRDLEGAVRRFEREVRAHLRAFDPPLDRPSAPSPAHAEVRAILRSDHAWFLTSLEQLDWFYRIVEGDDHGGHRQALGQYGRIFAEALQRHRRDERSYLAGPAELSTGAPR